MGSTLSLDHSRTSNLVPRGILPLQRKRRGKEVVEIRFHIEIQQFLFFFVLLAFIHG